MQTGLIAPLESEMESGEVNIEEEEESAPLKHAHDPIQPSEAEMEKHRVTHYPFRTWCKWCIMGRAKGSPHRKSAGSSIPRVAMDYFYITEGGLKRRDELQYESDVSGDQQLANDRQQGKIVKCLIVRCMDTKVVFSHVVPQKGDDEVLNRDGRQVRDQQSNGNQKRYRTEHHKIQAVVFKRVPSAL